MPRPSTAPRSTRVSVVAPTAPLGYPPWPIPPLPGWSSARRRRWGATSSSAPHVVVHDGVVIGDGVVVQDGAILGKPPTLAARSTAPREQLEALVIEQGAAICAQAIVFAGAHVGRGRDRRRPGLRARACPGRLGRGRRARSDGRQRRPHRRARAPAVQRLPDRLQRGRGRRLRRALRHDDQRRHDGPPPAGRAPARARSCAAPAGSAAGRCSCPASRSARRRSSPRARW